MMRDCCSVPITFPLCLMVVFFTEHNFARKWDLEMKLKSKKRSNDNENDDRNATTTKEKIPFLIWQWASHKNSWQITKLVFLDDYYRHGWWSLKHSKNDWAAKNKDMAYLYVFYQRKWENIIRSSESSPFLVINRAWGKEVGDRERKQRTLIHKLIRWFCSYKTKRTKNLALTTLHWYGMCSKHAHTLWTLRRLPPCK